MKKKLIIALILALVAMETYGTMNENTFSKSASVGIEELANKVSETGYN